MSRDLARARLLTVDGYGHTTGENPSTSAIDDIVRYTLHGALPAPGTVCQQNATPFSVPLQCDDATFPAADCPCQGWRTDITTSLSVVLFLRRRRGSLLRQSHQGTSPARVTATCMVL
jgi:hypothetical protein